MEKKIDNPFCDIKNTGEVRLSKKALEHPNREFTFPQKNDSYKGISWFEFEAL